MCMIRDQIKSTGHFAPPHISPCRAFHPLPRAGGVPNYRRPYHHHDGGGAAPVPLPSFRWRRRSSSPSSCRCRPDHRRLPPFHPPVAPSPSSEVSLGRDPGRPNVFHRFHSRCANPPSGDTPWAPFATSGLGLCLFSIGTCQHFTRKGGRVFWLPPQDCGSGVLKLPPLRVVSPLALSFKPPVGSSLLSPGISPGSAKVRPRANPPPSPRLPSFPPL